MVLHGICYGIAWYFIVLHGLHGVVQLIWRASELPRSASSHFDFKVTNSASTSIVSTSQYSQ